MIRDALPRDYPGVAELMRAFIHWHYDRHASDRAMIDSYFDEDAFEGELASLPGYYGPPDGALLVAEEDGRVVGCVALKRLDEGRCEMKRLFVDAAAHGTGAGQALARAIIDRAKSLGYSRMMLDTGPKQVEAQGLYRKLGFRDSGPYYEMSPELRDWLVFMELDLKA
ncbi:MAG: GNAT family N-acetyltransferase [Sphingomicrobium sp.]